MALSQNGWPGLEDDSKQLIWWKIPGVEEPLKLRHGCAGFTLCHFVAYFDARVEDIDGQKDDWGHAYRVIRGYSELSNHASGTAVDLNAIEHSLGKEDTFTVKEEKLIHRRLNRYEGAIRWGGDYRGRKDEMHFELDRDIRFVNDLAIDLMKTKVGLKLLELNPEQKRVILS